METMKDIKARFASAKEGEYNALFRHYENDERSGVQKLIQQYHKKLQALEDERVRTESMKKYEHEYEHLGYLCGIDEVGRGPLAGPVVACAVILPKDCDILWLNDSKKLTAKKREELYDVILEGAVSVGIGMASPERIDEINILQATYEAMRQAVSRLSVQPQLLLNDAVTIPEIQIPQVPIIKGDAKSVSIAAASIVAKVTRDRMMEEYDKVLPEYGFASNKGYGSAAHIEALKKYLKENRRQKGSYYEGIAAAFLAEKGLHIKERNFRCRSGEIDLVAQDGRYLVFIEVKYRKNGKSGSPFSAVGREKQRIISKVAMFYLIAHGYRELPPCRFDVVGIDGENIHWIKNAFDFCS